MPNLGAGGVGGDLLLQLVDPRVGRASSHDAVPPSEDAGGKDRGTSRSGNLDDLLNVFVKSHSHSAEGPFPATPTGEFSISQLPKLLEGQK